MNLEITTLDNGIRLAKLSGKMDIKGNNEVADQFVLKVGSSGTSTIVDLSDVSFMASLGIRTLLSAARGIHNKGGKMVLLNPQSLVKETLVIAGLENLLSIYEDFDEACAALTTANKET